MRISIHLITLLISFWVFIPALMGQDKTIVQGRVTDSTTGDPIPYAEIIFINQPTEGTASDFEGFYKLTTKSGIDSIKVSIMGYETEKKPVKQGEKQKINFQLSSTSYKMEEVTVTPGKYPSTILLENVWKNKATNNKATLKAYEYESYSRTTISVNNMSEDFKKRKYMEKLKPVLDSMQISAGKDGEEVLPVFVSETISKVYELNKPNRQKEFIEASNVTGVGLEDGSFVSQFVGASFQQYNFYENWLTILNKNFVSPIGESGLNFYEYRLVDTQVLNGFYCFEVQYKPKREEDLAFSGKFWIHDTTYALKRIKAETTGNANLNFIDKFKIHQDLEPTKAGPWLPSKTRVTTDVAEISDKAFGMIGKYYASNKNFVVNKPKDIEFYEKDIEKKSDYQDHSSDYWEENRHGKLSDKDKKVFNTVDSIRNVPVVKSYVEVAETLVSGHLDLGKVDLGPYILLYGNNPVEGHRFRIGAKTNSRFSKDWILNGYLAYGTKDRNFKYNIQAEKFLSRENWSKIGFQHKYDLEGLGVYDDFFQTNTLFQFSSQIGLVERFNQIRLNRLWFETDLFKGFSQRAFFLTKYYQPKGNYTFSYQDPQKDKAKSNKFRTTEFSLESRYAPKEKNIINGNERVRLRTGKAPVVTLRYTMGINDFLGGDFDYHKLSLDLEQDLNLGPVGRGFYRVQGTKIFNRLPYPLLNVFPGNETFVRSDNTYNLMNFYEFVADRSIEVSYTQHFDGFLLNRVPLVKELNLRLVGSAKAALGGYHSGNDQYIPDVNSEGRSVTKDYKTFSSGKPYVEVSYGFENILKFIRLEAIHRLTYLDGENVKPFGVKGSLYFSF